MAVRHHHRHRPPHPPRLSADFALLAFVLLLALLALACNGGSEATPDPTATAAATGTPSASPSPTPTTGEPGDAMLAGIYQRLDARLRSDPARAFRIDARVTASSGAGALTTWADGASNSARREVSDPLNGFTYTTIASEEATYTLGPNASITVDARGCPGASPAVALVLECPDREFETFVFTSGSPEARIERPEVEVREGLLDGREVIVVEAVKRQQPYRSNPLVETRVLYLDRESLLPVRQEVTQDPGFTEVREYDIEPIPRGQLAADFFDPRTLPAMRPDPAQALRERPADLPAFWLGHERAPSEGAPGLVLWRSDRYRPDETDPSSEQLMLEYVRADDVYGQTLLLRLTEYTEEAWDRGASGAHLPSDPCWIGEQLTVEGGTVTLYSGFSWPDSIPPASPEECPTDRDRDRFLAVVQHSGIRVVVEPWQWPEQSRDTLTTLVRGLDEWPGPPR